MDNRRVILFIVLSIAVMAIWQSLLPQPKRQPPAPLGPGAATAGAPARPGAAPAAAPGGVPATVPPATPVVLPVESGPPVAATREEQVVLTGVQAHAVLTNRGAQLLSFQVEQPGTGSVDLVRKRTQAPYLFALADKQARPLPVDDALFAVERGPDGRSATFRYRGPEASVEKTFRFDERGLFAVEIKASGSWDLLLGPGIGNPTAAELDSRYGLRGAVIKAGNDVKVIGAKDSEAVSYPGPVLGWAGLEDTFFAVIAVPQGGTLARA
ncbi:MAG: hypothetical protein JOZ15_16985, partial [Acidobacteria bacterium]|nr:hypothetical protein [Acidobacteriota bacterium]